MALEEIKEPDENYVQSMLLAEVVKRIILKKAEIKLSRKPTFELKPISEFMKRMRVSSFEKFNEPTYISTVNFYETEEDMEKHRVLGTLVLYIGQEFLIRLFSELDYPYIDEDDQATLEDACGTFCNLIGGNFKSALIQLGYKELVMSHFSSYTNEVIDGVEYNTKQTQKSEIGFEIGGKKRIIADLILAAVPKKYP